MTGVEKTMIMSLQSNLAFVIISYHHFHDGVIYMPTALPNNFMIELFLIWTQFNVLIYYANRVDALPFQNTLSGVYR